MISASAVDYAITRLADIAVYSHDGSLQLIVEVKNKAGATPDWAAGLRRNLLAHSFVPLSPFFLLALPDHFYLWKNVAASNDDVVAPHYDVDPAPFLTAYIGDGQLARERISEIGLELAVFSWLSIIIVSKLDNEVAQHSLAWLFDSGLYPAIKDGIIKPSIFV